MNNRNGFLDFIKYFAAIAIILVHRDFPGAVGGTCAALGNAGVCLFFLISGYACFGDKTVMPGKILTRFKRNGIITLVTVGIYAVFAFFMKCIYDLGFDQFIRDIKNPMTYVRMLTLGDFDFILAIPLWYMIAILYCYLIFILITKFNLKKVVLIAVVPLLLFRIFMEVYVSSYPEVSWHWSRNAIAGALPIMLLGYLTAAYKDKLKIKNSLLLLVFFASMIVMFVTANVRVGGLIILEPFKIICATSLFVYAVNNPDIHICKPVEKLGREDSLYIYLSHYMIAFLISFYAFKLLGRTDPVMWSLQFVVIAVVIAVSRLLSVSIKAFRNKASGL